MQPHPNKESHAQKKNCCTSALPKRLTDHSHQDDENDPALEGSKANTN